MLNAKKEPHNSDKYYWTEHAKSKLKQYGLSAQRVIRIVNHPLRTEEAVVPNCIACMQRIGNKKKTELWTMYQEKLQIQNLKSQKREDLITPRKIIISAWRYPGLTQPGRPVPIPEDTLEELNKIK